MRQSLSASDIGKVFVVRGVNQPEMVMSRLPRSVEIGQHLAYHHREQIGHRESIGGGARHPQAAMLRVSQSAIYRLTTNLFTISDRHRVAS